MVSKSGQLQKATRMESDSIFLETGLIRSKISSDVLFITAETVIRFHKCRLFEASRIVT